jgi:hypothetical protein
MGTNKTRRIKMSIRIRKRIKSRIRSRIRIGCTPEEGPASDPSGS